MNQQWAGLVCRACSHNSIDSLKPLITPENVNCGIAVIDNYGISALGYLCTQNLKDWTCIKWLVEEMKANVRIGVFMAVMQGSPDTLSYFLDSIPADEKSRLLSTRLYAGNFKTFRSRAVIRMLMEEGANLTENILDDDALAFYNEIEKEIISQKSACKRVGITTFIVMRDNGIPKDCARYIVSQFILTNWRGFR